MAIDFTTPIKTAPYDTGILGVIRGNQLAIASFLDGVPITAGLVAGVKRYNASSKLFEAWTGAAWAEMPLGYLKASGGNLTGQVTAPDPAGPTNLATRNYVDNAIGTRVPSSALASYAALSGASFTGAVGVAGNLSTSGSLGAAGSGFFGTNLTTEGLVLAADGTLTTTGQFYLGASSATVPIINFDANDYLAYDRSSNTLDLFIGSATPLQASPSGVTVNTALSWISGSGSGGYSADFRMANTHSGGGPYLRVNPTNGLELVDAAYANVNLTIADSGKLTARGLLFGRGGGAGLGQIIVQNGGSPAGGAPGDLWLIY